MIQAEKVISTKNAEVGVKKEADAHNLIETFANDCDDHAQDRNQKIMFSSADV